MKKKILLPLIALSALLSGCVINSAPTLETIDFTDGGNHDEDPTTDIVDTGENNEFDNKDDVVVDTTEPDTFDNQDDPTANEISEAGHYYFSGEYSSISITAPKNSVVYVYFDGVSISSNEGIAFGSSNAITLYLILQNNSINSIENDASKANAFHVKGNVYISGSGTLNINSKQNNGLKASKDLYVTGDVSLNVTGANHAITAQSITAKDVSISVTTPQGGKDGIQLECDDKIKEFTTEQGFAHLTNVTFTADTYGDAIQAESYIYISGGTYNVITRGVFVSYSTSNLETYGLTTDDFKFIKSGNTYKRVAKDEIRSLSSSYYALTQSCKGLKTSANEYDSDDDGVDDAEVTGNSYEIYIAHGAVLTFSTTDDAIHTNYGDVNIDSSTLTIDTYDDGVHADYNVNVNNASITVNSSYEGIEGGTVTIDGADTVLLLYSQDDGINAASDYVASNNVYIKNGYLRVFASGDGLDANTGLYLQGGTVIVEGPGSGNGSLDSDSVYLQGGTVFACSTSGMSETTRATQNSFKYQGSTMSAGSTISIVDVATSTSVFQYTLKQSCNQIIFSSASLVIGSSYKIVNGSTVLATISQTSSYVTSGSSSGGPGGGGGGPGGGGHGPGGW